MRHLAEAVEYLANPEQFHPVKPVASAPSNGGGDDGVPDFQDVRGQGTATRALEVAAAGGHNMLLIGPPGSWKTMRARRLPGTLPALTFPEALETTQVHSVAGLLPNGTGLLWRVHFQLTNHLRHPNSSQKTRLLHHRRKAPIL